MEEIETALDPPQRARVPPSETHGNHSSLSSRRRLADGFRAVKRYCGDMRKQVIQFQISGPTHVNHESIMQIAEFESGK